MIGAALAFKAAPYAIALALGTGAILYVRHLSATVDDQRVELDRASQQLADTRAAADALAHELDVAQSALVARDVQLAAVRDTLASKSASLRRVSRSPAVEAWARTAVPAAVAGLLERDAGGDRGADVAPDAAGRAAGAVPAGPGFE